MDRKDGVGSHRNPRLKDIRTDVLKYSTLFRINLLTWIFLCRMLQSGYSRSVTYLMNTTVHDICNLKFASSHIIK